MHYNILYIVIFIMLNATSCTLHNPCLLLKGLEKIIGSMSVIKVGICPTLELAPDIPMHRSQIKWTDFNNEASQ